jgi:hypothetical protein
VNRHLKLKAMAPERGRRRRVCQSTRRFVSERKREGSWVVEGDEVVKRGSSVQMPQEPRWMGLSVGSLAKNLL